MFSSSCLKNNLSKRAPVKINNLIVDSTDQQINTPSRNVYETYLGISRSKTGPYSNAILTLKLKVNIFFPLDKTNNILQSVERKISS